MFNLFMEICEWVLPPHVWRQKKTAKRKLIGNLVTVNEQLFYIWFMLGSVTKVLGCLGRRPSLLCFWFFYFIYFIMF